MNRQNLELAADQWLPDLQNQLDEAERESARDLELMEAAETLFEKEREIED